MKNKGQILIATIILIIIAALIVTAISFYLAQSQQLNLARSGLEKAVYAAQAGIYKAIVEYENTGSITEETDTLIDTNTYYSIGGSGMFFLADCSAATIIASRKLKNTTMTNVNSADPVTITHMQVSWEPDLGEDLISIDLGRATAEWTGTAPSGTNIDITNYTIGAGVTENDVWLDWEPGSDITAKTIIAVLTFSDGSSTEITLLNGGLAGPNAITITSTGKVTAEKTWRRTIKAGYDIGTSEIISWQESTEHL